MNLEQRIEQMRKDAEAIMHDYPDIDGLWFHFHDIPLDELRAAADKHKVGLKTDRDNNRMYAQFSGMWNGITCFAYSRKLKIETTIVEEEGVK